MRPREKKWLVLVYASILWFIQKQTLCNYSWTLITMVTRTWWWSLWPNSCGHGVYSIRWRDRCQTNIKMIKQDNIKMSYIVIGMPTSRELISTASKRKSLDIHSESKKYSYNIYRCLISKCRCILIEKYFKQKWNNYKIIITTSWTKLMTV